MTLRLDHRRCCCECQNIIPSGLGANQNVPNDARVKIMKQIAPNVVNAKDKVKLERIFYKIVSGENEEEKLKRKRQ